MNLSKKKSFVYLSFFILIALTTYVNIVFIRISFLKTIQGENVILLITLLLIDLSYMLILIFRKEWLFKMLKYLIIFFSSIICVVFSIFFLVSSIGNLTKSNIVFLLLVCFWLILFYICNYILFLNKGMIIRK